MLRVYLAGKMSNRYVEDVKSERKRATKELAKYQIRAVDPAAAEGKLWPKHRKAKISGRFKYSVMKAMVDHDKWLIRRCDVLLVLTGDITSEGTNAEFLYAKGIGIPVVMIAPERVKGNWMGWTNVLIGEENLFPDLKSAVKFIHKKYKKEYETNKAYFDAAIRHAQK
jgi:nucleoside 2-deoxyribosyltransferase